MRFGRNRDREVLFVLFVLFVADSCSATNSINLILVERVAQSRISLMVPQVLWYIRDLAFSILLVTKVPMARPKTELVGDKSAVQVQE